MKRLNDYKTRLVLLGFVAAIVLVGGRAKADFTFGELTNLGPTVNSAEWEFFECMSFDGLELYLSKPEARGGEPELFDLWVCTRATPYDAWSAPVNLGPTINEVHRDEGACISPDGLEMYFCSWGGTGWGHPGSYGLFDIWVTRRPTKDADWGTPENLGPTVNDSGFQMSPWVSVDGLELYFSRFSNNNMDIWTAKRGSKSDPWGTATVLGPPVNTWAHEYAPALSTDGLLLFFGEDDYANLYRPGGFGRSDMWFARRESPADPWGDPLNLGPMVNSPSSEWGPRVSPDGCTLYFSSDRAGGYGGSDIWQAPVLPVVDFNGDGIVDLKEFSRLAQYWGQDEPSVDMGPMPWGNGIVDVQDLAVLAENWLTEPGLAAHWKLDETEGFMAHDSARDHNGTLHGDPVWQPTDGKIDGALEFDGIDDRVSTPFVLNPARGPFSVFLWVKGEIPGQMILSQAGGANWLYTLGPMGWLMTSLGQGGSLLSQTIITDGQWHEIGLVWDGSRRHLYVDDTEVASDLRGVVGLASDGGLYFGAGPNLGAGTFFSGLIDDVKIYGRAVVP